MAKPPSADLLDLLGVPSEDTLLFKNPIVYDALLWSAKEIETSICDLFGHPLDVEPTIVTSPSIPINALSLQLDTGTNKEYVVLLNRGLFFFFINLTNLIARVVTDKRNGVEVTCSDGKIACERVRTNVAVQNDFARLLGGYLLKGLDMPDKDECAQVGRLTAEDPTTLDDAANEALADTAALREGRETREEWLDRHKGFKFKDLLLSAVDLFVVGHEYAHIVNRDKTNQGPDMQDVMRRNHQQEYAADWLGLNLTLQAQCIRGTIKPWFSYWGADFLLAACIILEQGTNIFNYGMENPHLTIASITHPTFAARRDYLRQHFPTIFGDETARISIGLANVLDLTLKELWVHAKPHIIVEYEKGTQLHPIWRMSGQEYEEARKINELVRDTKKAHV